MYRTLILSSLLIIPVLASSTPAHASIESCGDIHVEYEAECEVLVEGGCEVQCTPVTVEAACAGELQVECAGECDASAEVGCQASCDIAGCVAECDVSPPQFECTAECYAQADATCNAECQAASNRSECTASCKATYSAECDASCEGTPPEASCQAKCEASCEADCDARANVDCQVECQSEGYVDCKARVQGGCEAACQRPEGALFCDGQYVDAGNNLEECIDALQAILNAEVEASGTASGRCVNRRCEGSAEGEVSSSCNLVPSSPPDGRSTPVAAFAALLGSAVLLASRRRR